MNFLSVHILLIIWILPVLSSVYAIQVPCGGELIDSNKKQCCFGKAEPTSINKQCCYEARDFYITTDSICCDGKITPKYPQHGVTLECCNGKEINHNTARCCSNVENKLPPGHNDQFICCGTELINSTHQICCHNRTNESLSKSYVRQKDTFCCGSKLGKKECEWCKREGKNRRLLALNRDICEKKEIDLTEKSCCGGIINNVPRIDVNRINEVNTHFGCCGPKAYNTTERKCCNWKTGKTIPNNHQCMNDGSSFDTTLFKNCDGVLHKIQSGHTQCCGNKTFDSNTHQCCNRDIFDPDFEFCCGTVNAAPLIKGKVCCASQELKTGYLCCDDIKQVPQSDESHDKCCVNYWTGSAASFNSNLKECVDGEITTRTKDMNPCQFLDPDKAICCDGQIQYFPKDSNNRVVHSSCCGRKLLSDTEVCCINGLSLFKSKPDHDDCCLDTDGEGSVQSFNSQQQFCRDGQLYVKHEEYENCNGVYYSKNSAICCNGELHFHLKDGKLKCCDPGTTAYDERLQTCCHGNVYNVSSNNAEYMCCDGKTYQIDDPSNPCQQMCAGHHFNRDTHMCCSDELLVKGQHGDACCDGRPFFTSRKTCCSGALYRTPTGRGKCCGISLIRRHQRNLQCCKDMMPYDRRHSVCSATGVSSPRQTTLDKSFSKQGIKKKDGYQIPYCFAEYALSGRVKGHKRPPGNKLVYKLKVTPLRRFKQCDQKPIQYLTIVLHLSSSGTAEEHSFIPKGFPLTVFFNKMPNYVNGTEKATLHLSEKDMAYAFLYKGRIKHEMLRMTESQCLKLYFAMDSHDRETWKLDKEDLPWCLKSCNV
ncbi:uncharacterized protein LOC121371053 [Gigantopelta aegis]|uniref:uncharacterized protein LOC121371053 n=1 Tax=Gigantopelta aegis TaxID=1735272 RepID=UPI001B88AA7E|nr:uncharacterized protein LOC121371053 [Gigantopelta aegis]